jgi:hypothetical protein
LANANVSKEVNQYEKRCCRREKREQRKTERTIKVKVRTVGVIRKAEEGEESD